MTPKCVDFFCGGGGMSVGMHKAGIQVVAAVDSDPACQSTYEANHPGAKFLLKDIKKYPVESLAVDARIKPNDRSLIFIACAPCQYWSIILAKDVARKKKSSKSRNLLRDFLRFLKYYKPGYVVIENVRGIRRNPGVSGLAEVKEFFDDNGYRYADDVLSVADYGVPQTRQRYVLIATRNKGGIALPDPRKGDRRTVRDTIGDLPKIVAGETAASDPLHRSSNLSDVNIARLKLTREGGTRARWANDDGLLIDAYRGKSTEFFRDNYGRMSWDKPAPTITTRFFSLGCGKFGHPKQHRCISLREGALLQTFPKGYKFKTTTLSETARIIGNAVPPKFAQALAKQIVACEEKRTGRRISKQGRLF